MKVKVNIYFVTFSLNVLDVFYTIHQKFVVVFILVDVHKSLFMELITKYWMKRASSYLISTCYAGRDVICLSFISRYDLLDYVII